MKIVTNKGNCIQCGASTNIQLDCGKFACIGCLNKLGRETKNVREYLETFADTFNKDFMGHFLELLNVMKSNGITSVDNIINTLSAIQIHNEYKMVQLVQKIRKKLKNNLTFLTFYDIIHLL